MLVQFNYKIGGQSQESYLEWIFYTGVSTNLGNSPKVTGLQNYLFMSIVDTPEKDVSQA